MRLDVPPIAWHCLSASKHVQQKLSFSISYPSLRSSASRFFFGCALPLSVLEKNRTKCLQGTFDLKFFPPDFSGFIFSAHPAVRASLALPAVCASHASQCASVRRPRQPSTRQRPPARPRFSLREFTPAVRQPAPVRVHAPTRQPAPIHASRPPAPDQGRAD